MLPMLPMKRWVLIAVLMVVSPAGAAAAPPAADSIAMTLPPVEVLALRGADALAEIPAATFVLGRDELRAAGASRLADVLAGLPGLFGYRQRGSGDIEVVDPRGFTASGESSYLKLLVNGQDVRGIENGDVDWDWLLPEDVQRVEVVQGPGAWVTGDGSEGGIVNIVRPTPRGRLASDVTLRAGSFGLRNLGASGAAAGSPGSLALRASSRELDGWRFHSRERVYATGGEASRLGRGREVGVDWSYLDANRQDPGTLTEDQLAADREQSETTRDFHHQKSGMLGVHVQPSEGSEPTWRLSGHLRGEDGDELRTLFFQPLTHHTRGWSGGGEADWHSAFPADDRTVRLDARLEAAEQRLASQYSGFDPDAGMGSEVASGTSWRTTLAASGGARIALGWRTWLRASVRGDLARLHARDESADTTSRFRTLTAVSPMLGVSHTIADATLYASGSTAFRVPTLYQLYDRRPFVVAPGVSLSLSNPELDPQRSTSVEVGGRWTGAGGRSASVAVYSSRVRDEIDFDLASLSYANISRSWHRGIEAATSWPLPGRLTARGAGAWMPTTFRGGPHDGHQINGVPVSTGRLSLGWAPLAAVSADLGVRLAGRQWFDRDEQVRLPGFAAWDLGIAGRHRDVRIAARVSNLFNRRFSDTGYIGAFGESRFSPAAPRSVTVSLGLE